MKYPKSFQEYSHLESRYYITKGELADLFGITTHAVSVALKQNEIQTFKVGNKIAVNPVEARKFMDLRSVKFPQQVISFQMLKGGSTKTSSAFNLAVRLHQYGARVLAIDLDMQGNLSDAFGVKVKEEPVFIHVANNEATIQEAIIPLSKGLDIIPSDFENSTLDYLLTSKRSNLKTFVSNILKPVRKNYDFVIIDCNPALSSLNISIALACDKIIIPVNPDKFSSKGLKKTIEELERVSTEYSTTIDYKLLFTLFDGREAVSQKYLIEYGANYKDKLITTVIKKNTDVKTSIDNQQSIFDIKRAPAREDFDFFAREIMGVR